MSRIVVVSATAASALTLGALIAPSGGLSWRQAEIIHVRGKVHDCQDHLGFSRSRVAQRVITGGRAYRAWVLRRWRSRLRLCRAIERSLSDPRRAIMAVFGPVHGPAALQVADCESGLSVWAHNGQYLGLFQMGAHERATYGHGSTPLEQARAAHRYFVATGRDWSPWDCRPW